MSEPKELSPEELKRRLVIVETEADPLTRRMLDSHIAALTARTERAEADNAALNSVLGAAVYKVGEYAHAEECSVTDPYDNGDLDGCACALRHLPAWCEVLLMPHPGDAYRAKMDLVIEALMEAWEHRSVVAVWMESGKEVSLSEKIVAALRAVGRNP